jgi:hypothetical protein
MKKILYIFALCCINLPAVVFHASAESQETPTLTYQVVATFPSPGQRPQDIAWDGTHFWVVDDSTDTIYKLNPSDCSVLSAFPAPDGNTQGLAWDGSHLWAAGADSLTLYKMDRQTGNVLTVIPCTAYSARYYHATGIAFAGKDLYCCFEAGFSSQIAKVDMEKRTWELYAFTSFFPLGMIFDGKYLWYSGDSMGSYPGGAKGYIIGGGIHPQVSMKLPVPYPSGMAWDGTYYWIIDRTGKTIYKMKFNELPASVSHDAFVTQFTILQNYPNPFNPSTTIAYALGQRSRISINIYAIDGHRIASLADGPKESGMYSIVWNGRDDSGREVGSGTYVCVLSDGYQFTSKKITLLR